MRWRSVEEDHPCGESAGHQGARQVVLFDDVVERHVGRGEFRGMEFLHVNARRIINEVPKGTPVPFRYTINAYRGCSHACSYCFARPTHEYLDMNSGSDFERRIVVKVNAVERVRAELVPARWAGHHIAMGTNTDPYQRCEGKYRLTRGIVEALAQARNPFSILTKSTLILRDIDVLAEAATHADVRADLSIGTLDEHAWRTTESGTPHPLRRVEAVARLNQAGIPCGVLVAPVLPGISDAPEQVEAVVRACIDAGPACASTGSTGCTASGPTWSTSTSASTRAPTRRTPDSGRSATSSVGCCGVTAAGRPRCRGRATRAWRHPPRHRRPRHDSSPSTSDPHRGQPGAIASRSARRDAESRSR